MGEKTRLEKEGEVGLFWWDLGFTTDEIEAKFRKADDVLIDSYYEAVQREKKKLSEM